MTGFLAYFLKRDPVNPFARKHPVHPVHSSPVDTLRERRYYPPMMRRFWRWLFYALTSLPTIIALLLVLTSDSFAPRTMVDKVRLITAPYEFEFISWTANAIWAKVMQFTLGEERYLLTGRLAQPGHRIRQPARQNLRQGRRTDAHLLRPDGRRSDGGLRAGARRPGRAAPQPGRAAEPRGIHPPGTGLGRTAQRGVRTSAGKLCRRSFSGSPRSRWG